MAAVVKLVGFKVEDKRLRRLTGQMHARAMRICEKYANAAAGQAKASIDEPGRTGKVYHRDGKIHVASAPGEPPANDTGHLHDSIYVEPIRHGAAVVVTAEYAPVLEFGSRGGEPIAPRPFLKPAVEEQAGPFLKALEEKVFRN